MQSWKLLSTLISVHLRLLICLYRGVSHSLTHIPTCTHSAGIKTSWEGQGPRWLDNLNQTNCLNASILCHYVSLSLRAAAFRTRRLCTWLALCVCVFDCVWGGWLLGPSDDLAVIVLFWEVSQTLSAWGSTAKQISWPKDSHGLKKVLNVQDIHAAFGAHISFSAQAARCQIACLKVRNVTLNMNVFACVRSLTPGFMSGVTFV